jgi:Kef-type K+ transport system membrane component KefB
MATNGTLLNKTIIEKHVTKQFMEIIGGSYFLPLFITSFTSSVQLKTKKTKQKEM